MPRERTNDDMARAMREVAEETSAKACRYAVAPVIRVQTAMLIVMLSAIGGFTWYAIANSRGEGVQDALIDAVDRRIDDNKSEVQEDIREIKTAQLEIRALLIKALPDG